MGSSRSLLLPLAASVFACSSTDAANGSQILGSLLRPLDMFSVPASWYPSSLLGVDRVGPAGESAPSFLPRPAADMGLLDSTHALEMLSRSRQRNPLPVGFPGQQMHGKTTGFSSRKFTIVSALFGDDAADQQLREALGPPGSIHVEQQPQPALQGRVARAYTADPRLKTVNEALALHGFPPLPYMPPFLKDSREGARGGDAVEQLIERINSGEGLPETVINEFSSEEYSSFRSTWRLPSTKMPSLNKGLCNSPWPTPHRNGFAQASTSLAGPDGSRKMVHTFLNRAMVVSNPITLFYTADEKYLWGSSWTTIFKVARTKTALSIVDFVRKPLDVIMEDKFHGAYALLTSEEVFVVSTGKRLQAYYDKPDSNKEKIQVHPEAFDLYSGLRGLAAEPPRPREVFRALCMTHDGHIAWVTDAGRLGILSRDVKNGDFTQALATVMLGAAKRGGSPATTNKTLTPEGVSSFGSGGASEWAGAEEDVEVSNNIACDDRGGIFVVSSKYMHKAEWNGEKLTIAWEEAYDLEASLGGTAPVRLGAGSGSTPSLIGTDERRYVVITDSAKLMNLVIMNADTGKVEARHPINFGDASAKETSSEQSVLAHGWRMAVVNNQPTEQAKMSTGFLHFLGSSKFILNGLYTPNSPLGLMGDTLSSALPVLVGDAPRGVEQFEFDPDTKRLRRTWVNKEISIPNGIPTMSAKSGLLYGVGKRCPLGREASPLRGMWTVEAIDWWTGNSRFHYNVGAGLMSNSVYAATQVGPGEIITGTAGGIVRIKEV
ncbi:hypothetical protein Efla_003072 [Eimeria flavescens]